MQGICFTEPLFHKVVKGEKVQTRRMISHFGNNMHYGKLLCHWGLSGAPRIEGNKWLWTLQTEVDDCRDFEIKPKYNMGEKVYLKEPYSTIMDYEKGVVTKYKLDYPSSFSHKWKNKLFMPESAARYFIEIIGVRAERLQDISEEDCLKEGIKRIGWGSSRGVYVNWVSHDKNGYCTEFKTPQKAYADLIDKINGSGTWQRNPFVWVYDFKLVKPFQI